MHACMHACMQVCVYVCMYVCTVQYCIVLCCNDMKWHEQVCMYVRMYVMYACMYVCMHVRMYVFMNCIHVCVYVRACVRAKFRDFFSTFYLGSFALKLMKSLTNQNLKNITRTFIFIQKWDNNVTPKILSYKSINFVLLIIHFFMPNMKVIYMIKYLVLRCYPTFG